MSVQPRRAYESDAATETVRLTGVGFGYAATHRALRDVNLTLPAGSFHFLTGASGAGKSTLLKLLTLAERPLTGTLHLFGEDATAAPRRDLPAFRRRMGVVFQDFRLLDHLSAFDNVALPLRLTGRKQTDYAADVGEMLHWVGLGDRMDDRPPALSGGEKQRLAIARAVVTKPELILADEPTGSVDKVMGERLLKLFQSLNRLGTTVLIASHDEALAERSGATVLRLEGGRLSGGAT
ncbi:MAG: ATP-binding cassette domain-containing protein [Alphaproteobacteria bacterium]|uniref:cell division ATP-binding protein FtsE n=1 Tax=Brevundimonas sp. TaxID=1871086 RepID=UPI001858AD4B|nr:ATP-binding cassette domain-containing protein [Brevundimonas sp.]MBU3972158.1 ATP-binding cassette domain-containing protein [Alphaproteobacteria bacterium]MBA3049254.1 ATP-binding cassette domain-containing protein [Brevundimonas sp.]MBU3972177.1 ATP-binding cassette domain-containing protein [Alphaproteobacteria bacterium]MBU4040240.1 ATP-binding cassette domain-containing protein [Alphaproteobacteria bacterium]MBU4137846.1 ATP-binding cassette domain-containing protein [Alphaproteobacte